MNATAIQWAERTWNPVRGCSPLSPGCQNCYAARTAARFCGSTTVLKHADGTEEGPGLFAPYHGFAEMTPDGPQWTGRVELRREKLLEPLHIRKPSAIFVNSMSDLFHPKLPPVDTAEVFGVMQRADWHTYMVLTKRSRLAKQRLHQLAKTFGLMPHVWIGFSAEDQATFDVRYKYAGEWPVGGVLLVSLEPLLGPIELPTEFLRFIRPWVVVGGETGPGARPCNVGWIRSIVRQCRAAKVPCFVKQLGAKSVYGTVGKEYPMLLENRKGADPTEWSVDLMVREFPQGMPTTKGTEAHR